MRRPTSSSGGDDARTRRTTALLSPSRRLVLCLSFALALLASPAGAQTHDCRTDAPRRACQAFEKVVDGACTACADGNFAWYFTTKKPSDQECFVDECPRCPDGHTLQTRDALNPTLVHVCSACPLGTASVVEGAGCSPTAYACSTRRTCVSGLPSWWHKMPADVQQRCHEMLRSVYDAEVTFHAVAGLDDGGVLRVARTTLVVWAALSLLLLALFARQVVARRRFVAVRRRLAFLGTHVLGTHDALGGRAKAKAAAEDGDGVPRGTHTRDVAVQGCFLLFWMVSLASLVVYLSLVFIGTRYVESDVLVSRSAAVDRAAGIRSKVIGWDSVMVMPSVRPDDIVVLQYGQLGRETLAQREAILQKQLSSDDQSVVRDTREGSEGYDLSQGLSTTGAKLAAEAHYQVPDEHPLAELCATLRLYAPADVPVCVFLEVHKARFLPFMPSTHYAYLKVRGPKSGAVGPARVAPAIVRAIMFRFRVPSWKTGAAGKQLVDHVAAYRHVDTYARQYALKGVRAVVATKSDVPAFDGQTGFHLHVLGTDSGVFRSGSPVLQPMFAMIMTWDAPSTVKQIRVQAFLTLSFLFTEAIAIGGILTTGIKFVYYLVKRWNYSHGVRGLAGVRALLRDAVLMDERRASTASADMRTQSLANFVDSPLSDRRASGDV